ncbi:hypothetical protein F2Q69_00061395 [Brassica cretica]|uniref:Uncharacterized protein n=1 Tax=Brassica cretica TaxID=69181 RepID=A0A8S9RKA4_BRACR|nr:hypothetical protein F2Q69_00061395 [Brassica cretica]
MRDFPMDSASSPGSSELPDRNLVIQEGDPKESRQSGVKDTGKEDLKWVSVAQDKRSLKKYEVEVKSIDGLVPSPLAFANCSLTDLRFGPLRDFFLPRSFKGIGSRVHILGVTKVQWIMASQ